MTYGIENFSLDAPFSLLVSIILFFGVIFIGDTFQKVLISRMSKYNFLKYDVFFSPIIGTYLFIFPLFIILIFEINSIFFIKIFSYFIFLFGIINLYLNKNLYLKLIKKFRFKNPIETQVIIYLYLIFFLISASPLTHADTLDYHFLGALNLFNYGHFQKEILPMHNNLVSIGEIPITLGLSLGAEQFAGIIQFSSLLSLIPIFFRKSQNKLFLIAILACPITLFLISSPKPQLMFCITILLIYIFLIENFLKLKKKEINLFFFIGTFLLAVAFIAKYTFILSSFLLFIFSYSILVRKKIIFLPIILGITTFIVTILPYWHFRYQNFDTDLINLLMSPLPLNIYGYESLHNLLSGGSLNFINVFFLRDLKDFTTTFGPLFLILFFLISRKTLKFKFPLVMIIIFISCVFLFGSNLSRFLYEGYLWLIFLTSLTYVKKTFIYNFFSKFVLLQSFLIIIISLFFVIKVFPGSLNENLKKKVLKNNANGYELANWTNQKLDNDDILISTHRSISLFNTQTFSGVFTWHINPKNNLSLEYAKYLKSKKINRILFYGNKLKLEPYKNCLGKKLFYKKDVGRHVGRNPFSEKKYYDAWIYEFKNEYLPECFIK